MDKKKIEPTDAMVDIVDLADKLMVVDTRDLLRYALNHPDAAGLFADEDATDARPWEPLGESDQVCVGDEVKWDYYGLTMTATVARVDKTGSLYTAAGLHIGVRSVGTWYVRRPVQELPTEDGAVIVPADGHEFIEAKVNGRTYIAREAVVNQSDFSPANVLEGTWRSADNGARLGSLVSRDFITPGTWKVDDQ